jgi:hypothetical protein
MFMTTGLALILALIFMTAKLFIGCVIGLAVAALIYRSRWVVGLAIRAALLGGVAFFNRLGNSRLARVSRGVRERPSTRHCAVGRRPAAAKLHR